MNGYIYENQKPNGQDIRSCGVLNTGKPFIISCIVTLMNRAAGPFDCRG